MTADDRAHLLRKRADALAAYDKAMEAMLATTRYSPEERAALDEANHHIREAQELEAEYHRLLPRVVMSRCPFDGEALVRTFDPFGLDGPWWRGDASPEEPQACRHFCVLQGALALAERPPRAGDFEVRPGPQAPFVIPRLLGHDGMVAVVSQLRMENGFLAYPIAYFAERRPPPQELAASWARPVYLYTTQLGETAWRVENERWDFDLQPWLNAGKLRWASGGGDFMRLESKPSSPFVGLPGERQPAVLQQDQIWFEQSPDGSVVLPVQ